VIVVQTGHSPNAIQTAGLPERRKVVSEQFVSPVMVQQALLSERGNTKEQSKGRRTLVALKERGD